MPDPGPFDEALLARRYARLTLRGPGAMPDFLHRRMLEEIAARLSATRRRFTRALLCTLAPADAVELLRAAGNVGETILAAPRARPRHGPHRLVVDPAAPPLAPTSLDLLVCVMEPAFINDLPAALRRWRTLLRPGGLLLAALPGGDSLRELRAAWALADMEEGDAPPPPRVAPFCDVRQLGALLQMAGYAMPVVDVERLALRHADALSLMQELRAMGLSNMLAGRSPRPVSRRRLARAAAALEAAHGAADGRTSVTMEILHVAGWAPRDGEETAAAGCALP